MRDQSNLYYTLREHVRRYDPGLSDKAVAAYVRAWIRNGLVREERRIVDHDGQPIR